METQDYLNTLSWKGVERAARLMLDGEVPDGKGPAAEPTRFRHGMLRWAVSDTPAARLQWSALARASQCAEVVDRDVYVERLWAAIHEHPGHEALHRFIRERWGAEGVYQEYLFSWFLRRSYFPGALRVLAPRRSAALLIGGLLAGWLLTLVVLWSGGQYPVWVFFVSFVWLLLGCVYCGLPARFYAALLLPRLLASVIVGYLFLAAAPDLVRMIHEGARGNAAFELLLAGLLAAGISGYTMFHISRWVHPPLVSLPALARRAAPVLALGVLYSTMVLALLGRLLFSASFLYGSQQQARELGVAPVGPEPVPLVLAGTIALALGVVLELAWEDKPLTEPL